MGTAVKTRSLFRMQVSISENINADPGKIWGLLTNAADFPRWNSTVQSVEGRIALNETIRLTVKVAPSRVFKLKVVQFIPNELMVWQDGAAPMFQGTRRYTLQPKGNNSVEFTMSETFAGLMLPMIAGSLPDFRQSFEQYAADLKRAAEQRT